MSLHDKAVFLSYASQDAEAAKRMCDALRAAGVEVWFDQNELVGGDAWDAKIRGQIASCALFIPVISASTQARLEGYFRREWKQAAARTQDMADEKAFLLPVVIDDTKDAVAKVPAEFKAVQWTRLAGGEATPAFVARVKKLLSDEAVAPTEPIPIRREAAAHPRRRPARGWWALPIFGVTMALVLVLKEKEAARPDAPATPAPAPNNTANAAPLSESARLARQAYAVTQRVGFTREDLGGAVTLAQKAVDLEPGSARAQAVLAWTKACYLMRNWDISDPRIQEVQAQANRALGLDPSDADALNALSNVFEKQRLPVEAEKIARRAVQVAPDNYRSYLCLGRALNALDRNEETIAVLTDAARRFPTNVLCRYELAQHLAGFGMTTRRFRAADVKLAMQQLDEAIAIQPFASAILVKANWEAALNGDVKRMRAELDRLDLLSVADRTEDRSVFMVMWCGLLERQPERVITAAKLTARPYFEDTTVAGPRAWGLALAYRIAGKEALARTEWRAAETVLRQRLRDRSTEIEQAKLATTLAWLGEDEEAARIMAPIETAWREDLTKPRARDLARYYAARGDAARAVPYLREVVGFSSFITPALLALDPNWDKLRGQPEFEQLLAEEQAHCTAEGREGEPASAAPVVDDKSVAVLAFANLSDDKANEYFSDGISEELLNVLAQVPGLKVSARTSAFFFKGKEVPIPEIARQLGVAYVVEGSVRKAGDKVRITAQLIKAADGFHVWSDTFTRDLKDIFAVQDEIAGLIAQNLRAKLATTRERPAPAPAIYALILQARHAAAAQTNEGARQAIQFYQQALAQDAKLADAWAELALCYVQLGRFGGLPTPDAMREARLAARRALDLEPEHPFGWLAMGWVQRTNDRDWRGAIASFRRALASAPGNVTVMSDAAICFLNVGFTADAETLATQAAARDPLNPRAHWSQGAIFLWSGRPALAVESYRRAVALAPTGDEYHSHLARALALVGRYDEAMEQARLEPNERYRLVALATIQFVSGNTPAGDKTLQEISTKYGDSMSGYLANLCAIAGKVDDAFKWLERGYESRDAAIAWVKTNASYRSVTSDPRWAQFLRKMGLADDQLK
ncbi:TIR domain-containing protein [Oleiharenicola sp. Vm1]|uniref:TIR domain-containing protein n=1 Tax=Oleiharenicola sp. Vm1 TaxID=3398393 RepID=UPI0039F5303C